MPIPLKISTKSAPNANRARAAADWTGVWALSIGAVAVGLASFIYVADGNTVAAAFVLLAVAAIIGVVLCESTQPNDPD